MPSIRGSLIRVPDPPPKGKYKAAKDAIKSSPRVKRAKRKVTDAYANRRSEKGWRAPMGPHNTRNQTHGQFGRATIDDKQVRSAQRSLSWQAAGTGLLIGVPAGVSVGGDASRRHQQIMRNKQSMKRNQKKLGEFEKRRYQLITDLGTGYERTARKVDFGTHPYKAGLAGIGIGAGATAPLALKTRKKQRTELRAQQTTLKAQRAQLRAHRKVNKSARVSAFGVMH